jgi:hypothetical protein
MALADEIERLRNYPENAAKAFRDQLERARNSREKLAKQDGEVEPVRGVDRSGELAPLPRPVILRSLRGGAA